MRQLLLSIFLWLISFSLSAQLAYIPDPNFRAFLQQYATGCMVGDSLDTQCIAAMEISSLHIESLGIADLTGISYFEGLSNLFCDNNSLTWLPMLPNTLSELDCSNNQLTSLPALPVHLNFLYCSNNQLTELPDLPNSLVDLECGFNQLTHLPPLPSALDQIDAPNNLLTELPQLDYLNYIDDYNFNNNQIEVLPTLPAWTDWIELQNNNIHCLPILPAAMGVLRISGNPIDCLPNLPNNMQIDVSLPICTSNNIHDCTFLRPVYGNVYQDLNDNCQLEQSEAGLQNRIVQASNGTTAISDAQGNYRLYLDTGDYTVTQMPLPLLQTSSVWDIDCPSVPYQIVISQSVDSVPGVDFPNTAAEECHWLWVDVASSNQRPCFGNNSYHVSYCNYGSEPALAAYVDLEFPESIIPLSSSISWQGLGNGVYRFDLGSLAIDECGSFNITDSVSCDAEIGFTACVTAEIFPHSPCLVGSQTWDNSNVEVSAQCNGSQIAFTISNEGTGNMGTPSNYRIYEDNALFVTDQSFQLDASQTLSVPVPATGKTYRLEADQSLGHPGFSMPRVSVEGCGGPPVSLGQMVSYAQDDMDDHIEIVCTELSSGFDPNDKQVVPSGYGLDHLVHPNDSILEYMIRFQNTGNDTAFNIEVVDTLRSDVLDPATFLSGSSSHPYTVRMHGDGIVTWRFENILLPDSTTNEAKSHGFVKFKVRTRPNLANGTVINNFAAIYFDYNAAIITNTAFITISDVPIVASVQDGAEMSDMRLYPNPVSDNAILELGTYLENGSVVITDALGRQLGTQPMVGTRCRISGENLSQGIYFLSIYNRNMLLGTMRLTVVGH